MRFHADLHVHSKYSRATSRDLDLEHLAAWAARKGIGVVGTGDFTHPVWRAELKDKLVPAEPGLFRLRPEIEQAIAKGLPPACHATVRFMLSVEISTIYKKGEKTRKIHHLIYAAYFATADRISERLARIGNIASDGRPILGLDSRNLLEITLESSPDTYFIPARIWTPWFAALGSQSGFDSITECYGDLAGHIFAVETGLSSDPPMNWRLSMLDRYRLVSNSDAHSPGKLGREATTFDCDVDYFAIRKALETGQGYVGTVEFFPEEGKYHLDGHRKCGVKFSPQETLAQGGRCPVCGGAMTIGVLHRIEALADRSEEQALPPPTAGEVSNLVPLPELLGEIADSGPGSKTVERGYGRLLSTLGSELSILQSVPLEDIARADSSLVAEAIARLRAGKVIRDAGYDGEYGVIRLFEDDELRRRTAGGLLFEGATFGPPPERGRKAPRAPGEGPSASVAATDPHPTAARSTSPLQGEAKALAALDDDQRAAASVVDGPLLIVAGPGSGKTRTLMHRIVHLVTECGVAGEHCLAITFTRRAAAEMKERLHAMLGARANDIPVHTFHSLGLAMLREHPNPAGLQRGFRVAGEAERVAALAAALDLPQPRAQGLLRAISKAERMGGPLAAEAAEARTAYRNILAVNNWIDFDDLVTLAVRLLANNPDIAALYRERFRFVSVDEFQDVDRQQYQLVTLLAPPSGGNLCVIGDPHQAIYGFRGADASCFSRFTTDYPDAIAVALKRNYRSSGTIVAASSQIIAEKSDEPIAEIVRGMHERVTIHAAPSERAEAEFVVATIEQAIGGASFFSIDSGRATGQDTALSFADFAVLYRTDAQAAALVEALARSGMPFRKHSHAPLAEEPMVRALLAALDTIAAPDTDLAARLEIAAQRVAAGNDDTAAIALALQRLLPLAKACGGDQACFLDAAALASDADFWDARADGVALLTLHAAKGLEFACVFIVGLEDGLLPLHWGKADDIAGEDLGEERRLFYVGMTRAKDRLLLSRALKRQWRGRVREQAPSPFLADIESEFTRQQQAQLGRKPDDRQLRLL
ncbi:MAG TPA: UvrD-helicase domain-containing protein [Xanthobacteraceae bacterium]|nr:UvrD-helicase domain-containing protein [Xanthobacteraceae bacterium]